MKLSEHFTLEELIASDIAARHGIDNIPSSPLIISNLKSLAEGLEDVRKLLGKPITINSGYRSLMVNSLLGSKPTSQHTKGLAADFVCPSFGTPKDIIKKIVSSDIKYDQVILEFDRWIHISFCEEGYKPRKQALIIDSKGTRNFN
jgi:zinc D-Ala-D-Ala carboxypeptidase